MVTIVRTYVLYLIIIIKWEVWNLSHYLELVHEAMVCTECHIIFVWLLLFAGNVDQHNWVLGVFSGYAYVIETLPNILNLREGTTKN